MITIEEMLNLRIEHKKMKLENEMVKEVFRALPLSLRVEILAEVERIDPILAKRIEI